MIKRRIIAGILDNILILYAMRIGVFCLAICIEGQVLPWIVIMSWLVVSIPVIPICICMISGTDPEIIVFLIIFQALYYWLEQGYYYICYRLFDCSIGQLCMRLIIVDKEGNKLTKQKKRKRSGKRVLLRYAYYIPLFSVLMKKRENLWYDDELETMVISRKEYREKYMDVVIQK